LFCFLFNDLVPSVSGRYSTIRAGVSNVFLLIFVLLLNETIIRTVHRSKKYAQTQNAMMAAARTVNSANSALPNFRRRHDDLFSLYSVFPVIVEGMAGDAALSVVACHIYGFNIVSFRS
jgi:hypothetical protein